ADTRPRPAKGLPNGAGVAFLGAGGQPAPMRDFHPEDPPQAPAGWREHEALLSLPARVGLRRLPAPPPTHGPRLGRAVPPGGRLRVEVAEPRPFDPDVLDRRRACGGARPRGRGRGGRPRRGPRRTIRPMSSSPPLHRV